MSMWNTERKRVLETSREMLNKGLVIGTSGNVSQRLPADTGNQLIAITPSGIPYDSMGPDDIQVVDSLGQTVEGDLTPSTETRMHLAIYKSRDMTNAVIHTHSVYASALSVIGTNIPPIMEDQLAILGGEIKVAKHAVSGSPEQAEYVLEAMEDRNAVLLPNHGAVGIGNTLEEALTACELLEKTAKIYILARLSGNVNHLPPEIMSKMKSVFTSTQSNKKTR